MTYIFPKNYNLTLSDLVDFGLLIVDRGLLHIN